MKPSGTSLKHLLKNPRRKTSSGVSFSGSSLFFPFRLESFPTSARKYSELVCAPTSVPSLQQEEPKGLCAEIRTELLPRTTGDGIAHASTETEVICQMFHTVSRMRENCMYGSMRGRTYPAGASRSTLHPIEGPHRRKMFITFAAVGW